MPFSKRRERLVLKNVTRTVNSTSIFSLSEGEKIDLWKGDSLNDRHSVHSSKFSVNREQQEQGGLHCFVLTCHITAFPSLV